MRFPIALAITAMIKKMANQETLIFFVRKLEELDKPFVTIEYSLKTKQILQCYAYRNSKPEEKV